MDNVNLDKKKLLLVAISVGIFLVITIGAAILISAHKNAVSHSETAALTAPGSRTGINVSPLPQVTPLSGPSGPGQENPAPGVSPAVNPVPGNSMPDVVPISGTTPDPVNMIRNPGEVPGLTSPPEGAAGAENSPASGTAAGDEKGGTLINVPRPTSAAVPDAPPAGRAVSPARRAPVSAPKAPAPAPAKIPAKPAAQPKVYDDYWVQTGAFSTVNKAEGVKDTLASRGITSIIENREVDGKTFFRVRVGPYTSQNEADYWLSLIKTLDGFEESQVRLTQSRR